VLRNPDYLRYVGAVTVSNLGSASSGLALPLLALALGASVGQVGLLITCGLVAEMAARLPAGQLADQLDRRWLMLGADLARLAAFSTIPLVWLFGRPSYALLLFVCVAEGVCGAIFTPAASAAMRDIVAEDDELAGAISKIQAGYATVALVGPALGGWLFSIGPSLPFAVDAVSYAVSAALLLRLKTPPPARLPESQRDRRFTAGWRWLATQPDLLSIVLFGAVLNLASGAAYITLVLGLRERGMASTTVGVVVACGGGGALVGALLAPRLIRVMSNKVLLFAVGSAWTAGMAAFIGAPPVVVIAAVFGALLTISPASGVLMGKSILSLVPRDLLGRVRTAIDTVLFGIAVLAPLLAGVSIERFGLARTWLILAIVAGIGTVVGVGPRSLRHHLRPAAATSSAGTTSNTLAATASAADVQLQAE